jgi:IclR family transcriptional regulator, pca regulon regulatory protein
VTEDDETPPTVVERDGTFVQSLDRGLAVIRAFDRDHPRLTLSDVARATGLTRAAARRFLLTLVQLGYVGTEGRDFFLRPRVLELGYAYLSGQSLPEVCQPHLEELSRALDVSSSVAVLDDDDVVYVARMPSKRIMAVVISVGTRFPAYATSLGRVLLAGLTEADLERYLARVQLQRLTGATVRTPAALRKELGVARDQGWCIVDQELEDGLRSAAAPVRDREGRVVAAVNVSVSANSVSLDKLEREHVPLLLSAAERIGRDLAHGQRTSS